MLTRLKMHGNEGSSLPIWDLKISNVKMCFSCKTPMRCNLEAFKTTCSILHQLGSLGATAKQVRVWI